MAKYKVEITGVNTSELPVLSEAEQIELFKALKSGDSSVKKKLIEGNLKLVLKELNALKKYSCNLDDLFQAGVIGLIKAIDNFDISYNFKLSTYAIPLIIGEMKRFLRENQTSLRVSRGIRSIAYDILKYKETYAQKNGVEPTNQELEKQFNITPYELSTALDSLKEPVSIFEPIYNDGGDTIYVEDQIADKKENKTNKEDILSLNKALSKLRERERNILINRYMVGKTQMELAKRLNISQAQVSRIEKNAIRSLKRMMK